MVPHERRLSERKSCPTGPDFATYFKRVATAFQRCKNQQKWCSYGRDRISTPQVDLIETTLAKTEPAIAAHYETQLVDVDADYAKLGSGLRKKLAETTDAVLAVSGRDAPAGDNFLLQRALALRNPYVDVLNLLQAELLKRERPRGESGLAKILRGMFGHTRPLRLRASSSPHRQAPERQDGAAGARVGRRGHRRRAPGARAARFGL